MDHTVTNAVASAASVGAVATSPSPTRMDVEGEEPGVVGSDGISPCQEDIKGGSNMDVDAPISVPVAIGTQDQQEGKETDIQPISDEPGLSHL